MAVVTFKARARRPSFPSKPFRLRLFLTNVPTAGVVVVVVAVVLGILQLHTSFQADTTIIYVFVPAPPHIQKKPKKNKNNHSPDDHTFLWLRKQYSALLEPQRSHNGNFFSWVQEQNLRIQPLFLDISEQRKYVARHSCGTRRFDELIQIQQNHLATEFFKYCALQHQKQQRGRRNKDDAVVFVDLVNNPLLVQLPDLLRQWPQQSIAVLNDDNFFPNAVHGSFLVIQRQHSHISSKMLNLLTQTPISVLTANPLLIPRTLHSLIAASINQGHIVSSVHVKEHHANSSSTILQAGAHDNGWYLMQQSCRMDSFQRRPGVAQQYAQGSIIHTCPAESELCCSIRDVSYPSNFIFMSRFPLQPYQIMAEPEPRQPLLDSSGGVGKVVVASNELPFISSVTVERFANDEPTQDKPATPNLYDILNRTNRLPVENCTKCLRLKTCIDIKPFCSNYMNTICEEKAPAKRQSLTLTITPPLYHRDPTRLIPRIVHQTWYEKINKKKYPNMSRLVQSFKDAGWEYKFYTDDDAEDFLRTHFPTEVLEAYQSLIPGAFKADLFRYCALLIHGGVYADVDIILESNLDQAIPPDVGFAVPMDEVRWIIVQLPSFVERNAFYPVSCIFSASSLFVARFYCCSTWTPVSGTGNRNGCQSS